MKAFILLILFTATTYGQQTIASTKVTFVENVLKSIQTDDFELFKKHVVDYELLKLQDGSTEEEYNARISMIFVEIKEEFTSNDSDFSEYKLHNVEEPYHTDKWLGYDLVRFHVILKSVKGDLLILDFSDCPKTAEGYKLGEAIRIVN